MLKLELFSRRNFAVGNAETLSMYAGVAILFFFLVIYLQEVAGYSAVESGLTTVPVTLVMFALSRRFGALADRHGPRLFMGCGPLVAAGGILLLLRVGMHPSYLTDLLPALLLFARRPDRHRRAADGDGARRRRRNGRRHRLRDQQRRSPGWPGWSAWRWSASWSRVR